MLLRREDITADSMDSESRTPLSYAAENGHEMVVKMLLGRENVVGGSMDGKCQTPFSMKGQEVIRKVLLR
jgi:ankyrin repeat protein